MKKIGTDFQGWPINALTWREILDSLGIEPVDKDLPILDVYPRLLIDDGMGYGAGRSQYITEIDREVIKDKELGEDVNNVWRDEAQDNTSEI